MESLDLNYMLLFAILGLHLFVVLVLIFKKVTIIQQNNAYPPRNRREILFYQICIILFLLIIVASLLLVLKSSASDLDFIDNLFVNDNTSTSDVIENTNDGYTSNYKNINNSSAGSLNMNIYDTDPKNDSYIKKNLSREKLEQFDDVLEYERMNCLYKISSTQLRSMTNNDEELIKAYQRWIVCKNMKRNTNIVVYPSERNLALGH